jgi:hypothetical protein
VSEFVYQSLMKGGVYADTFDSIELATSGTHAPTPSEHIIEDVLLVGFSANAGNLEPNQNWQQWDNLRKMSAPKQGDGLVGKTNFSFYSSFI